MGYEPLASDWSGDGRDADGVRETEGESGERRVFAPLLEPHVPALTDQLEVATTLARATGADLQVADPTALPGRSPEVLRRHAADDRGRELLDWAVERAAAIDRADGRVLYSRRLVTDVLRTVAAAGVDTLVLPGKSPGGLLGRDATERIALHADCDVVVVNGRPGYDEVPSVLLPVAGGPHSGLAADVARRVAEACDAWVDVLHVVEEGTREATRATAERFVEAAARRIGRPETTSPWILEAGDAAEAIIEQSKYYGLTVVGAPTTGRLRQFIHGSTNQSVRENARSVVLSARNNTGAPPLLDDRSPSGG